ncbi:MAG: hypothetical protein ACOX17_00850 [Christensenellales bacterium]|jgi:hypothetical protein
MLKKILISLIALALLFSLAACGKDGEPEAILSELQGVEGEAENALPEEEAQPEEEAELEESEPEPEPEPTEEPLPTPDPEPGIPAPAGWPEDIPTPATGEILGGGWAPDRSFYTTDIVYKQADIDAYGRRLESYGFLRQEEHDYGNMWPDATVYSNGQWDVLVAEENDTFEYSYVNFYPLFDAATEGYAGQPEGWPEEGGF